MAYAGAGSRLPLEDSDPIRSTDRGRCSRQTRPCLPLPPSYLADPPREALKLQIAIAGIAIVPRKHKPRGEGRYNTASVRGMNLNLLSHVFAMGVGVGIGVGIDEAARCSLLCLGAPSPPRPESARKLSVSSSPCDAPKAQHQSTIKVFRWKFLRCVYWHGKQPSSKADHNELSCHLTPLFFVERTVATDVVFCQSLTSAKTVCLLRDCWAVETALSKTPKYRLFVRHFPSAKTVKNGRFPLNVALELTNNEQIKSSAC